MFALASRAPKKDLVRAALSVDGQGHPASFSLVARTSRGVQLLQDGTQQVETLQPAERVFYKIIVPASAAQPVLLVSPYQGSVSVELSSQLVRIDEWPIPPPNPDNPDGPGVQRTSATADAPGGVRVAVVGSAGSFWRKTWENENG